MATDLRPLWLELREAVKALEAVSPERAAHYLRGAAGSVRGLTKALQRGGEDGDRERRAGSRGG